MDGEPLDLIQGAKGSRLYARPNWRGIVAAWRDGVIPRVPWGWEIRGQRLRCARCQAKTATILPERINDRAIAACSGCMEAVRSVWLSLDG